MNTAISNKTLAFAAMIAALLAVGPASADDTLSILDLQYQEHANVSRMVLMANLPFMYKMQEGGEGTLIVEIDKADISRISRNYTISAKAVQNISVSNSFAGDGAEVTEFIIKYDPSYHFSHELKGRRLFISFSELSAKPVAIEIGETQDDVKPERAKKQSNPKQAANVAKNGGEAQKMEQPAQGEGIQPESYHLNEINLEETEKGAVLRFSFDKAISSAAYKVVTVGGPARYVIDFHGALNGLKNKNLELSTPFFNRVRTAQNRVDPYPISRIVLDQNNIIEPALEIRGKELYLLFDDAKVPEKRANASAAKKPVVNMPKDEPKKDSSKVEIEPLEIVTDSTEIDSESVKEKPEPESKKSNQLSTEAKKNPEKKSSTDIGKVESPKESTNPFSRENSAEKKANRSNAKKISPEAKKNSATPQKMAEKKPAAEMGSMASKPAEKKKSQPEELTEKTEMFETQFPDSSTDSAKGSFAFPQDEMQDPEMEGEMPEIGDAVQQKDSPVVASDDRDFFQTKEISSMQRRYSGRLVSLEFESIPLSSLILLLGQMTDKNFLVDPSVRDVEVSISLKDLPWDQALDVVLDYNSLGKVEENNLIRIATQAKLAQEAEDRRRVLEQRSLSVPLRQVTKPINYAKATNLENLIRRSLSTKGEVVVDDRTNTLVITDIPSKVDEHLNLIAALDVPTKQVIIEARIIETTRDFINEFGLQYGYSASFDTSYGNSTGLLFPNSGYITSGFADGIQNGRTPIAINLPAPQASTSLLGSFSSLGGTFILDAVLTMAETDRKVRVLSRPRISASNNQRAEIKSGVEVPYQVIQNNTVSIRFREATLKLEVTPHITADGTVIMDVVVDKSSLGIQTPAGLTIQTRKATSTIRVKDGGVAVIGGVLEVSSSHAVDALPVLSKIPLLGALFRSDQKRLQNTELLIFISPRIIG